VGLAAVPLVELPRALDRVVGFDGGDDAAESFEALGLCRVGLEEGLSRGRGGAGDEEEEGEAESDGQLVPPPGQL